MRLLNVNTLSIDSFVDDAIPPYVCLSHRWGPEEVTLQEMQIVQKYQDHDPEAHLASNYLKAKTSASLSIGRLKDGLRKRTGNLRAKSPDTVVIDERIAELEGIKAKQGYVKIAAVCSIIRASPIENVQHAWIDTCCIDKTSSAELSEAINSMWLWYKGCKLCIAYLQDVGDRDELAKSEWFERAWTLQEMLAPDSVIFLGRQWEPLGFLSELRDELVEITGIHKDAFQYRIDNFLDTFSVTEIFSWAALRKATRKEDLAYSLLGLFNISMPLLYGEGEKAFLRLQGEIIRTTGDLSLFIWTPLHRNDRKGRLFARSAAEFTGHKSVSSLQQITKLTKNLLFLAPCTINNLGVESDFVLIPWSLEEYLVHVGVDTNNGSTYFMRIRLLDRPGLAARIDNEIVRLNNGEYLDYKQARFEQRRLLLLSTPITQVEETGSSLKEVRMSDDAWWRLSIKGLQPKMAPVMVWNSDDRYFVVGNQKASWGIIGTLSLCVYQNMYTGKHVYELITLALDFDYNMLCQIRELDSVYPVTAQSWLHDDEKNRYPISNFLGTRAHASTSGWIVTPHYIEISGRDESNNRWKIFKSRDRQPYETFSEELRTEIEFTRPDKNGWTFRPYRYESLTQNKAFWKEHPT